jgi:hypothetical protein
MRFCAVFSLGLVAWEVASAAPPPLPAADPEIQQIVSDISAERIQRSIIVLSSFKTRHTLSDPQPSGDGIGGACAWIRAEFERVSVASGGRLKVALDEFIQTPVAPRIPHPVKLVNVVATLPGTRPDASDRVYVISGHYDSIVRNILDAESPAPGADDDASGVAAVLELARVMSGHEFPATIVFLAVAGEEQGLLGSAHWAAQAKSEHRNIAAMLDDDIVGSTHGANGQIDRHTVRLFAQGISPSAHPDAALRELIADGGENDTAPRELARSIRELAAIYVPSMTVHVIYRMDRYHRSSDHQSFLEQGYGAVRFTEPAEDYHREHEYVKVENGVRYGDTPDRVDFVYTADVARINAAALGGLALAPAAPAQPQLENVLLENDSTLRWAPNAEPNLAGYRIVWRDTAATNWEDYVTVPKTQTRYTLKGISKDNVIFGVQAFDTEGHLSPAVFPLARSTL